MLLLHRKQTTSAVCLTVLTDCAIPGNSFIIPASLDKIIPFSCADCIDMLSAFYVRVVLTVQRNCLFFIGIPGDSFVLPAKTDECHFFKIIGRVVVVLSLWIIEPVNRNRRFCRSIPSDSFKNPACFIAECDHFIKACGIEMFTGLRKIKPVNWYT